ncbi:MAG TPA: DUF1269 domain-containing protein [Vicinamibacterales bacterium]|nr:DUF1269 domain-containing protein [Vicinamibacterales bacterium]
MAPAVHCIAADWIARDAVEEGNLAMERMLVVVFDSETKAFEATRALQALDEAGFIAVYADGVITRGRDGAITESKTRRGFPQGTMGATAVGSLIGAIGGPVGVAVGAAGGLIVGGLADHTRHRIARDFVDDVKAALRPGRSAMVAEIDEEATLNVDERMEALGGFVFRRAMGDVADDEYDHEIASLRADVAQTKAEHAASHAERRSRLQARLDSLNEKLHGLLDRARARRDEIQRHAAAKVEHLQTQAHAAAEDVKARRADRLASVTRRYDRWFDKQPGHAD